MISLPLSPQGFLPPPSMHSPAPRSWAAAAPEHGGGGNSLDYVQWSPSQDKGARDLSDKWLSSWRWPVRARAGSPVTALVSSLGKQGLLAAHVLLAVVSSGWGFY